MKIKDLDHMALPVNSQNMIKESNESESNEGIWYDFDNIEDFIDSVDVKKFAYDITNHSSFSEALSDYTANDYEDNEFGERIISWVLPDSGIDLAIKFDFPTFADLIKFANSNYTEKQFIDHVDDVWCTTDPNSNYNDFWSDMDELLQPSDYGYSEYTTDNDYDVTVSPTNIKFNSDGLCIDDDFHILENVSTDLNFVKIPNNVALIKCFAFDGCSKLTDIVITGHIKYIDSLAFAGAINLKNVYYIGSKKDWRKIKIGRGNENLTNATIHYDYKGSSNESLDESLNLGDKVNYHGEQYIIIDDSNDDMLVLRPFDRFKETDFDDIESGDNSEDVYIAPYQILNNESLNGGTDMNKDKTYIDLHGGFGEPGEKITFAEIKKYWDDNFDTDPCLQEYDSEDEEDVDKKIEESKSIKESSTLSKLVKSGYTLKEIQKFFKDETGLDMTPENSEEFKKWSARFLKSINESKSIKESVSSGKYSLNFGYWRTGNGKSFNSDRELIEFLEDNYIERGTVITQSQNVTDQFSKYFQHPPKDAHISKEFFDRGYELIVESKSIKESLDEDLGRDSSYKDAKQLIEDIDKFLKEIEENGVSAQYFSSDDLDALHKGRDAIFDFTVVYEENGFSDVLGKNVEYKLAFKPVNDVTGINCVNGLISVVKSAGFNFKSARKIADDYYITIICEPKDLSRAKLAIENCGFFKSWLKSNESIKTKSSKLALVNESGVYRFKTNK